MQPILDLELLRTFVLVARTGELKKAAEQVYRSQAAVSMQIKRLEELTGHCLLQRSNRGTRLTEAGETLLQYSEQMLQLSSAAFSAINKEEIKGQLSFGIPTDYAQDFLNYFMPQLAAGLPALDARIVCDRSRNLREMVNRGQLDIAIVTGEDQFTDELALWREKLFWCAPVNKPVDLESPIPLGLFEDDCILRDISLRELKQSGLKYQVRFSSPVLDNIAKAVELGFVIALLPESLLHNDRIRIPEQDSFPQLPDIHINMISSPNLSDEIRERVSECFRQSAQNQRQRLQLAGL